MRAGLQIRLDTLKRPPDYSFGSSIRSQYAILNDMPLHHGTMTAFKAAAKTVTVHRMFKRERKIRCKVLCLGTGKSMPDQYRNGKFSLSC